MARWWSVAIILIFSAGCSRIHSLTKNEIISQDLPLAVEDIEEIRSGDDAHKILFEGNNRFEEPKYKLFTSPELHAYVAHIGLKIAQVSDRPNLPYRFFIIDSDEIDIFGLGGGRVYITRGFFNFIQSENELAGGLSHEISHIANYDYKPPESGRIQKGYNLLMKGSENVSGFAGHYGAAANTGLRVLGNAAPAIKKKFQGDQCQISDKNAIRYLMKAGYDPKGLFQLVDRMSKVPVEEVGQYVDYMKGHTPSQKRRFLLEKSTRKLKFKPPERTRLVVRDDQLVSVPAAAAPITAPPVEIKSEVKKIAETHGQGSLPVSEARALTPQS